MGNLSDAITQAGTWTVSGVTVHPFGSEPEAINYVDLPVLLLNFAPGYEGMKPFDIGLNAGEMAVFMNHRLLFSPGGLHYERRSAMLAPIEAYLSAVVADWTLDGNLAKPMEIVNMQVEVYERRGLPYMAATFYLRWVVKI